MNRLMKSPGLATVLTAVNLVILLLLGVATLRPVEAQGGAPIIRARAFELVDERGRVRAELKVFPPDLSVKTPDGSYVQVSSKSATPFVKIVNKDGREQILKP